MTTAPPLSTLRRYLPAKRVERCELCGLPLAPGHQHLLEVKARRIACSCEACSILFEHRPGGRYRRIGRSVRYLGEAPMTDAEWESLHIPIGLAFFVRSAESSRIMAFYPGPAGCTESLLPLSSARIPELEPDVEALLVNRVRGARDHFVVPIDRCYHLVGLIRSYWRGLGGGEEVWRYIDTFFEGLREAGRA
jgi:hypothetical protein